MARAHAGSEATEKPTPRRLRQARQEGRVALSLELSRALAFVALLVLAAVGVAPAVTRLVSLFRTTFATPLGGTLPLGVVARAAFDALGALSLAPLVVVLLVAVAASAVQTRGLFAWRAVALDLGRLSPAQGWHRLFSARTLGDAGLGALKMALVLAVVVASLKPLVSALPRLAGVAPGTVLVVLGAWTARLGSHGALVLIALGVLDAWLARLRHQRALMMTRDEVKRDQKEDEGDPRHKAERRRHYRESNGTDDVRTAAFVVAEDLPPAAVAVRYERASEGTPVVVVKGEGPLAAEIVAAALRAGVPLHRDAALIRALNDVPVGAAIPPGLFERVAEALRAVWGATAFPVQAPSARPAQREPTRVPTSPSRDGQGA